MKLIFMEQIMDIGSIILISGALLVIPLMYAVRQIFIEGKLAVFNDYIIF